MTQRRTRWVLAALVAAGLALSGCAETSKSEASEDGPGKVVSVPGSDIPQVVLVEKAAERIGIEMAAVTEEAGTKIVPYASVVYDANGDAFAYTSPKPLTFVRTPITVASITGENAFLSAGPVTGTDVVTVGTAELFGTEQGIGH